MAVVSDDEEDAHDLLLDDPFEGDLSHGLAAPAPAAHPASSRSVHFEPQDGGARPRTNGHFSRPGEDISNGAAAYANGDKIDGGADWHVEGPGKRVGYDDFTAIDWIFEYTKERRRLRRLRSQGAGLLGWIRELLDGSQIWLILIAAGIAVGFVAAGIDIVSDWLGDLREGYCASGKGGGRFYLSEGFCCWGLDNPSQCRDWTPWSTALGISSSGGAYVLQYWAFIIFSTLFAVAASLLVRNYAGYARHSGIPEIKTILGGFVIRRYMGSWTLIIKSLGLCLAAASGLWLGKEGPLVHIACCCAYLFMKLFPTINDNEARKREVLSAAAAAGISVAFASPIGGVLFSLEQLSYYFPDKTMWQSFVCAMVAAVTLQAIDPFRTGKLVLYQVTYTTGWHGFEFGPFLILGALGGVYGGLLIKLNIKIASWRRTSFIRDFPVLEVALAALVTAVINYPNPFMRAQSSSLVASLFAECSQVREDTFNLCKSGFLSTGTIILLLLASMIGSILTAYTFGLLLPAGVILPSMTIGALTGRALGHIVQEIQRSYPSAWLFAACEPDVECVTPGTYAIIGAAGSLAGVTRMTVSIVVIMFELTGALTYVLPIMVAVMLAKWVGDAFSKRGIYESWIRLNEYPLLDNRDEEPIPDISASEVMTRIEDLALLSATGHTIDSLNIFLEENPQRGFPVVLEEREPVLVGYISRVELKHALNVAALGVDAARAMGADIITPRVERPLAMTSPATQPRTREELYSFTEVYFTYNPMADPKSTLDLRPWMDQTPITLSVKSSLKLTVDMFTRLGLRYVLFVEQGLLCGLLTKKDIWLLLSEEKDDLVRQLYRDSG